MTNTDANALLTVKELARAVKRSPGYVYTARMRGFKMPGGVATVAEFRAWLAANPAPRSDAWRYVGSKG